MTAAKSDDKDERSRKIELALRNLLKQVDDFCATEGEADFYTGEAVKALAAPVPESRTLPVSHGKNLGDRIDQLERELAEERISAEDREAHIRQLYEQRIEERRQHAVSASGVSPAAQVMANVGDAFGAAAVIAEEVVRSTRGSSDHDDAERWRAFCNLWAASTEMKVAQDEDGGWSIFQVEDVEGERFGKMTGETPDKAIDLARTPASATQS